MVSSKKDPHLIVKAIIAKRILNGISKEKREVILKMDDTLLDEVMEALED